MASTRRCYTAHCLPWSSGWATCCRRAWTGCSSRIPAARRPRRRCGSAVRPPGARTSSVSRWLPWPDRGRGLVDHLRHEIPLWLQPADGRRACVAVPRPRPLRLADRAGDRIRARPTRLHIADIERAGGHGCFLVEPVLGEGGYVPANQRFLEGLRERADAHGMLLVLDEVQTGFGRTGKFWGHDHFNARPDILVTAKGLASGFPLSGIAAPSALMEKAWPGSQGGTHGANAVACAAALATLDVIRDEHLVDNSAERGAQLKQALQTVADKHDQITDVRGLGLMIGNEVRFADGKPDGVTAAA